MDTLSGARAEDVIARVDTALRAWNLREPALVLLAMHLPVAYLGSQLMLVAQPMVSALTGEALARDLVWLVQDPQRLEQLVTRLEQTH